METQILIRGSLFPKYHQPLQRLSTDTRSLYLGADDQTGERARHSILDPVWKRMEEMLDKLITHVWVKELG